MIYKRNALCSEGKKKKKKQNETIIVYKMEHQKVLLYFSPKNQSAITQKIRNSNLFSKSLTT